MPTGEAVDEQLAAMGVAASELDLVLLSHLDCDHANGLSQVKEARRTLVSRAELEAATRGRPAAKVRFNPAWWEDTGLDTFEWNGTEGPFRRSCDVFGDDSFVMIHIPGHTEGLCALRIKGADGRFVLLYADGGYAALSWEALLTSGIAVNREQQLKWIRDMSLDEKCIESLATHDPGIQPHVIEL